METQINNSLIKINELNKEINNINSKNYELAEKLEEQTRINDNLQIEINSNNKHIDKLTKKYNDLKSNNTYFEEKQLNEVFSIHDLWMETFNESINTYERIIFATNKFKPENIIIGQDLISAKNKEVAVQWLKVVKTALYFIDSKDEDDFGRVFKKENSINNKKNSISSSEIHEVKEKPIKKEKEDINSRIMNLWE
jgi:predicted nuclease with TOPRIM domain